MIYLFATIFICVANVDIVEMISLEIRKCLVYNAKKWLILRSIFVLFLVKISNDS